MAEADAHFELNQQELDKQVGDIARQRMASLQRRIANQARQDVPVKTGNLGRSIREGQIRIVSPTVVEGSVEATAPYAAAVHEGSRPHVIRPRTKQYLRFNVGGRVVFAKSVNHPGAKARPFLRNAALRIIAQDAQG